VRELKNSRALRGLITQFSAETQNRKQNGRETEAYRKQSGSISEAKRKRETHFSSKNINVSASAAKKIQIAK
jgi:hypothetical protein